MSNPSLGRRSRPGRLLTLSVVGVTAIMTVIAGWGIWSSYRVSRAEVVDSYGRLAYESMADASQFLRGRLDVLAALIDGVAIGGQGDGQARDDALAEVLRSFPATRFGLDGGLAWYDLDGRLRASSRGSVGEPSDEVAAFVGAVAQGEASISTLLTSPEYDGEVVLLAIPTLGVDGRPNGVVAAALTASWLDSVAQRLDVVRGVESRFFDRDGVRLTGRHGATDLVLDETSLADAVIELGPIEYGAATRGGMSPDDEPLVLGHARDLGLTGWTVLLAVPEQSALAEVRGRFAREASALGALTLLITVGAVVLGRRLDRLASARQEAEDAATREGERATTEAANLELALAATETGWFRWPVGDDRLIWRAPGIDDPSELPPTDVDEALGLLDDDARSHVDRAIVQVLDQRTATDFEVPFRDGASRASEPDRWLWVYLAPIEDDDGRIIEVVGLIRDVTERRAALEDLLAAMDRERTIATTLQQGLLPHRLPEIDDLHISARYRAAGPVGVVGGDFYDVFVDGSGAVTVALGDVCGRGIDAAMTTSLARHTLRAAARQGLALDEQMRWLHDAVVQADIGTYVTCVVARCRRRPTGELEVEVALAGHPSPIVLGADGAREIGTPGTLLGMIDIEITPTHHVLGPTDRLVLYTDGLTDSPVPRLTSDDLLAVLGDLGGLANEELADALLEHSRPPEEFEHDDTALVIVSAATTAADDAC